MNIPVNPFDFNFERTEFSDENYSIVGRALTIATKFEKEVQAIANFLKLKADPLVLFDDKGFAEFIEKLERHHNNLKNTIDQLKFDTPLNDLLTTAKNSRNFIAHDLTIGLEITSETDIGRQGIINDLKQHIGNIAEAEKFLLTVFCIINKEQLPNKGYFDSFGQKITDWVIKTKF